MSKVEVPPNHHRLPLHRLWVLHSRWLLLLLPEDASERTGGGGTHQQRCAYSASWCPWGHHGAHVRPRSHAPQWWAQGVLSNARSVAVWLSPIDVAFAGAQLSSGWLETGSWCDCLDGTCWLLTPCYGDETALRWASCSTWGKWDISCQLQEKQVRHTKYTAPSERGEGRCHRVCICSKIM